MAKDESGGGVPAWAWAVGGLVVGYGLFGKKTSGLPPSLSIAPSAAQPPRPGLGPMMAAPYGFPQQQQQFRQRYEPAPEIAGMHGQPIPQMMNGIPVVPLPAESAARTRKVRGGGVHGANVVPPYAQESASQGYGMPNETFGGSDGGGLGGESF